MKLGRRPNESSTDLLQSKLNINAEAIEIERAHRTGRRSGTGRPRHIVVKLLRYKDKEKIMRSSKSLKGSGVFINEDFSSRVMMRRQERQEQLRRARQQGKIAYFNVDRLIVKERVLPLGPMETTIPLDRKGQK